MVKHVVYETLEPCCACGRLLLRLEPDVMGWSLYCTQCEHLTAGQAALASAHQEATSAGGIGIVTAVPMRMLLQLEPIRLPP